MSFTITQGELEFQSGLILNGQAYKVFLATKGQLTIASTLANWEAAELTATNGYAAVTGTIGTGVYNGTTGRVEPPAITGQFGPASGAGFTFDAMVIKIGTTRTRPYAVRLYDAPVVLAAGQSRGFSLTLGMKP
jgi:hypothetical protein